MQTKTKLIGGLSVAVFCPLLVAAIILQPGTLIIIALGLLIALLATWFAWRVVADTAESNRTSAVSGPAAFEWKQANSQDLFLNKVVSTLQETFADFNLKKGPLDHSTICQEVFNRLEGLKVQKKCSLADVESKEVTVVLTDLRGFTSITEQFSALEVVDMLNRYFTVMCEIIYRYGGTVDKFVGDSIMALFGAPFSNENDVINALCCAVEMQIAMNDFNAENKKRGLPDQYMGIGVNTGLVIAGKIGSKLHSEYTVIGDEINLTSRIEAYTLRGQILISDNTYRKAKELLSVNEPIHISVKGKRNPLCIYELVAIGEPYNLCVPDREIRRSLRARVNIPFKFHICIGKIVSSDTHEGRILNISTGGMRACTLTEIEPHLNIKFRLNPSITGVKDDDIYGKIIKVVKKHELYEANIEFTAISSTDSAAIKELVNNVIEGSMPFAN